MSQICQCIVGSGPNKGKQCANKGKIIFGGNHVCGLHKNCKSLRSDYVLSQYIGNVDPTKNLVIEIGYTDGNFINLLKFLGSSKNRYKCGEGRGRSQRSCFIESHVSHFPKVLESQFTIVSVSQKPFDEITHDIGYSDFTEKIMDLLPNPEITHLISQLPDVNYVKQQIIYVYEDLLDEKDDDDEEDIKDTIELKKLIKMIEEICPPK